MPQPAGFRATLADRRTRTIKIRNVRAVREAQRFAVSKVRQIPDSRHLSQGLE